MYNMSPHHHTAPNPMASLKEHKTVKETLSEAKSSNTAVDTVPFYLRSNLIDPHMPSPHEILPNRTDECPGQPFILVNMEEVCSYLIERQAIQNHIMMEDTEYLHSQAYTQVKTSFSSHQRAPVIH